MALIDCKECGRQISNEAAACPGCGVPLVISAKSQNPKAFAFSGMHYLRMNKTKRGPDFIDQWLNFSTRFGVGILGVFLAIISLVIMAIGLFFLFWLGYFLITS